jgi:hypothetical protein
METRADIKGRARKLLFPAAVSVVGGGLGWLLSRKPKQLRQAIPQTKQLRQAIPQLPDVDVGDLKDDLRGRLDFVLGKNEGESRGEQEFEPQYDRSEFEERRQERQRRRKERKQRLKA